MGPWYAVFSLLLLAIIMEWRLGSHSRRQSRMYRRIREELEVELERVNRECEKIREESG